MPSKPTRASRSAERVAQLKAEAARRERNRRLAIAGAVIGVVVVVVVALVTAKVLSGNPSNDAAPAQTGVSQVVASATNVPPGTLNSVGVGTASNPPQALTKAAPLTADGKPEFLYMGGEFCPYCAATRWGVVVALSRFGTFTGLGLMSSSSTDVYPDTPTLTFHGASFTSSYLTFHGYELSDRNHQTLDTPPSSDNAIFHTYDSPPYVSSASTGSIPFIDIAGKYFLSGTAYDPQLLHGLSHLQVAQDLKDPASPVAQAVDGEANLLTAAICSGTDNQPAAVCSAAGVTAAAAKLASGG